MVSALPSNMVKLTHVIITSCLGYSPLDVKTTTLDSIILHLRYVFPINLSEIIAIILQYNKTDIDAFHHSLIDPPTILFQLARNV
jgi:hypothetical protein